MATPGLTELIHWSISCKLKGSEHMEWPAVSPDTNPIENMWYEVTRTMDASANQPTNLEELRQAVIDV